MGDESTQTSSTQTLSTQTLSRESENVDADGGAGNARETSVEQHEVDAAGHASSADAASEPSQSASAESIESESLESTSLESASAESAPVESMPAVAAEPVAATQHVSVDPAEHAAAATRVFPTAAEPEATVFTAGAGATVFATEAATAETERIPEPAASTEAATERLATEDPAVADPTPADSDSAPADSATERLATAPDAAAADAATVVLPDADIKRAVADAQRMAAGEPLDTAEGATVVSPVAPAVDSEAAGAAAAGAGATSAAVAADAGARPASPATVEAAAPQGLDALAPTLIDAPTPPKKKGNRLMGVIVGVIATVAFGAVFAAVALGVFYLRDHSDPISLFERFVQSPAFWLTGIVFFVAVAIVAAIVNRAGWWAHMIGSLFVGGLVYFGYLAGAFLTAHSWTLDSSQISQFAHTLWADPIAIGAGLVAREVAMWFGAWTGARGKKVRARNLEAKREYERGLEDGAKAAAA
jgi:hypothetical protein